jgi:iron(III) transport system substrate-binding protein
MAFSDPEEVAQIASNFTDYAPPNASDYHDPEAGVNHTWPRAVGAWTICSNTMIEKDPPNSWQDLTKPQYKGHLGEVTILTGGSGWTRSFFQRTVFGKEYWQKLADNKPRLYPSGVPMTDAMIRGEVSVGAIVVNQALPRIAEGAPLQCRFGAEGIPTMPQMIGLTKTAQSPNAARLYLNWMLSPEGQAFVVKDWYMFSGLEGAPRPVGADKAKTWSVNREDSRRVHAQWTSDWVQIFSAPK